MSEEWIVPKHKWITPVQLAEVCSRLPPDARIRPNRVGNLVVRDANEEAIGWIDLAKAVNGSDPWEEFS